MYSFDGRVRYSECDSEGRLTIPAMVNYLQDCSTFHSDSVGLGMKYLNEQHQGWILATWVIEINRLPEYAEHITISTWCTGMGRFDAKRNFTITDDSGEACVRADSEWYLYDLAAGTVIHIPEVERIYVEGEKRLDMPPMRRKIPLEGEVQLASPVNVGPQHLDTNKHVNNAQYVLFAADALGELGLAAPTDILSVQYRNMARVGDTIVPEVHGSEGGHTVALTDGDKTTYAVVRFQAK